MVATTDFYDFKAKFKFIRNEAVQDGVKSHFIQYSEDPKGDLSFVNLEIYKSSKGITARQTNGKYQFFDCSEF